VVREDNVGRLSARLVLQGANIPITDQAEAILHERGVLSIPDFVANAGGVICAAVEYQGGTESSALQAIEERVARTTRELLDELKSGGRSPREAAFRIASAHLRRAMETRRWSIY
jgi:glutamate dehydrogenase (NAD(P)+)